MTVGKRLFKGLAVFALGALVSAGAIGQVTSRFTVPGGSATTSKILPGATVSFDVRVDAPATQTIGAAFRILQTSPAAPSSFFTITARNFTGSIYNDTSSGTADAVVFALPSALLNPDNDDNLGRNTIGLVGTAAGTNLFVANYTLTSNAATPLGVYRIQPTPGGTSAVTDAAFNDYDMSAALFDIVVGQTLTVTKSGTGTGTVTSDVGLINCGAVCSDIYPGSVVTLTPTATGGSTFIGWTGACAGAGACVVTVDAAKTVNAQFDAPNPILTVTLAGSGIGVVTSVPAGINCGATCSAGFVAGTSVVLTAVPTAPAIFTGWSGGGCSGNGTCTVVLNANTTVIATFDVPGVPLTVTKAGFGTGTVTSVPAGISCGATCSTTLPAGTSVVLTAVPDANKTFTGWSGVPAVACPDTGPGTSTCTVVLTAAQAVTANFGDVVAPITTITGNPTDPSNQANPTFTFTVNEAPVTSRCSLDGAVPSVCTSPITVSVANGPHTFTVTSTDPAGNVGNTASFSWTAAGVLVANVPVPTLNEWMLVLLALILGSAGILAHRRRG